MKRIVRRLRPVLLCASFIVVATASAQRYAVNSLGTLTMTPVGGYAGITGPGDPYVADQAIGLQFISAASGVVDNVAVGLTNNYGANDPILVSLYSDNSGQFGTLLESWNLGPVPSNSTPGPMPTVHNSLPSVSLTGGQAYWITLIATGYDTGDAICLAQPGYTAGLSGFAGSHDGGVTWSFNDSVDPSNDYGFSVTVAAPEPAPIAALGAGILGLMLRKRRSC
jgi:hypothetical protein